MYEIATLSILVFPSGGAFGREKPNPPRYGLARSISPLIDGIPPYDASAGTKITEEERILKW